MSTSFRISGRAGRIALEFRVWLGPTAMPLAQGMGGVYLHVHRYAFLFRISGAAGRIAMKFSRYTVKDLLARSYAFYTGQMAGVHLHLRTRKQIFCISGAAGCIVLIFGVLFETHLLCVWHRPWVGDMLRMRTSDLAHTLYLFDSSRSSPKSRLTGSLMTNFSTLHSSRATYQPAPPPPPQNESKPAVNISCRMDLPRCEECVGGNWMRSIVEKSF